MHFLEFQTKIKCSKSSLIVLKISILTPPLQLTELKYVSTFINTFIILYRFYVPRQEVHFDVMNMEVCKGYCEMTQVQTKKTTQVEREISRVLTTTRIYDVNVRIGEVGSRSRWAPPDESFFLILLSPVEFGLS